MSYPGVKNGTHHVVHYSQTHLFCVLLYPRLHSNVPLIIKLPKRKKLPQLGSLTRDVQLQGLDPEKESKDLTLGTMQRSQMIIGSSEWDEMKNFQAPLVPVLNVIDEF